jgi:DNA polymerase (family X)
MDKSNTDVTAFLRRVADLLEIRGENPFKVRSYRTAAGTVDDLRRSVAEIAAEEGTAGLQQLPGIGKSISTQVAQFVETGTSDVFEAIRAETPETVLDLMRVRGIGMKLATRLHAEFGMFDLDDLAAFTAGGGFDAIPGLPEKLVEKLVANVAKYDASRPSLKLAEAWREGEALLAALGERAELAGSAVAGQARRRLERVTALDLLTVAASDREDVANAFARLPGLSSVDVVTPSRAEGVLLSRVPVTLHVATQENEVVTLVRATGSRRHVVELAERAATHGLALAADGLYDARGQRIPLDDEVDLYARLGLQLIPPIRREGADEISEYSIRR